MSHRFFVWEEEAGDQRSVSQTFQGPWIEVASEGYEPLRMPLSELLEREGGGSGPFREVFVRLRRGQPSGPDLAALAGNYVFGDGFIYQHLEVSPDGRYHFQWHDDVKTNEPHDKDRNESRGRCSMVNGVLRLIPEGPFSSDLRSLMRNDFIAVPWGGRRYLLPSKERLVFCSVVNLGEKVKYMRDGRFSIDSAPRRSHSEGLPEVPREWAPFLLQRPVSGTITEILADQVAIMDVGTRDGVRAGMEFVREEPAVSVPDQGPLHRARSLRRQEWYARGCRASRFAASTAGVVFPRSATTCGGGEDLVPGLAIGSRSLRDSLAASLSVEPRHFHG